MTTKKLGKEERERGQEFAMLWKKISEYMAKALHESTFDPKWEDEFLAVSLRIAEMVSPVANSLGFERSFVNRVIEFLDEVFGLRYLKEIQEFQVTLLRDRWSAVNLELSRVLGFEITRLHS